MSANIHHISVFHFTHKLVKFVHKIHAPIFSYVPYLIRYPPYQAVNIKVLRFVSKGHFATYRLHMQLLHCIVFLKQLSRYYPRFRKQHDYNKPKCICVFELPWFGAIQGLEHKVITSTSQCSAVCKSMHKCHVVKNCSTKHFFAKPQQR